MGFLWYGFVGLWGASWFGWLRRTGALRLLDPQRRRKIGDLRCRCPPSQDISRAVAGMVSQARPRLDVRTDGRMLIPSKNISRSSQTHQRPDARADIGGSIQRKRRFCDRAILRQDGFCTSNNALLVTTSVDRGERDRPCYRCFCAVARLRGWIGCWCMEKPLL